MRRLAATIALAGALAGISTAASAATRPTLETAGIPSGVIVGHSMPYIETKTVGHLRAGYHGHLPAGAKLQLLVKRSGGAFRALPTKVRLSGSHATIAITERGIGGPVGYEVALVSGNRRLAISKAVSVYWTRPPGGIFVLGATGGGSAYTSLTVASESCASEAPSCKGDYIPLYGAVRYRADTARLVGCAPLQRPAAVLLHFDRRRLQRSDHIPDGADGIDAGGGQRRGDLAPRGRHDRQFLHHGLRLEAGRTGPLEGAPSGNGARPRGPAAVEGCGRPVCLSQASRP